MITRMEITYKSVLPRTVEPGIFSTGNYIVSKDGESISFDFTEMESSFRFEGGYMYIDVLQKHWDDDYCPEQSLVDQFMRRLTKNDFIDMFYECFDTKDANGNELAEEDYLSVELVPIDITFYDCSESGDGKPIIVTGEAFDNLRCEHSKGEIAEDKSFSQMVEEVMAEAQTVPQELRHDTGYIVYRKNDGNWDWAKNTNEKTIADPISVVVAAESMSCGGFSSTYDRVLKARLFREAFVVLDEEERDRLYAVAHFVDEHMGYFEPEEADFLTQCEKPLAMLDKILFPIDLRSENDYWQGAAGDNALGVLRRGIRYIIDRNSR